MGYLSWNWFFSFFFLSWLFSTLRRRCGEDWSISRHHHLFLGFKLVRVMGDSEADGHAPVPLFFFKRPFPSKDRKKDRDLGSSPDSGRSSFEAEQKY
ncbi:hypothetical protein BO71DRAFT_64499 [Aspergillus ellipticus CBS 707.79]|uniref:Uncharacterized protein n=1 Tax=Aspergillus ellipticus CBS 707.79 TaxID=1448320 RepID=A0A319DL54_9EURO|nr:hypothetical protein BO71DRAFT_64499 [Aspergillus ellipticus CBS 707.79]